MNKKMVKVLKDKYVYVDIDGTLAEYRFNNHVSAKDGTNNGQTLKEIENHIFLRSRPLKSVIKTLKRSKMKKLFVCGAIVHPTELEDKTKWLNKYCSRLNFTGKFWFVPDKNWTLFKVYFNSSGDQPIITKHGLIIKGSKNEMWSLLFNGEFDDVVFIDDRLDYIRFAEESGITAYHISSFIE